MQELNVKFCFHTDKIPTAEKIFNNFSQERKLDLNIIENLNFKKNHLPYVEAHFLIKVKANNTSKLVWEAVNTMEIFNCYNFNFNGHSHESFQLITNNVSGAMGGISTILIQVENNNKP